MQELDLTQQFAELAIAIINTPLGPSVIAIIVAYLVLTLLGDDQ